MNETSDSVSDMIYTCFYVAAIERNRDDEEVKRFNVMYGLTVWYDIAYKRNDMDITIIKLEECIY